MGAAAAGGLAIAAKGAAELENIQVDLQRETGLTADAAKEATSAINGIAGRNVQDLATVSEAFAKVHNDLGLTGQAAIDATESFVKFGRATKQGPAAAVAAFDDILDSFGLSADKAQGIMDKLVVSHQKYGGSIEENEAALAKMAPQLKALNLGIDDGIGLLNLFASSGLDASQAQRALNSAITKLPPGTTLQEFLTHLSTVKDDGARAQEAIKVFGARAGAGLANAIKPGTSSLQAFEVSAADAAGATQKAADVIDSSFTGRIQKVISQASAALRGFGSSFGPALTGAASLTTLAGTVFPGVGAKLGSALIGGIKGIGRRVAAVLGVELGSRVVATAVSGAVAEGLTEAGGSSAVTTAARGIGLSAAGAIGAGLLAGIATLAVAKMIGDQLERQKADLTNQVDAFVSSATIDALKSARDGIQRQIDSQKVFGLDIELFNERSGPNSLDAQLQRINDAIAAREHPTQDSGAALGQAAADGVASKEAAVTGAGKKAVSGVAGAVGSAKAAVKKSAQELLTEAAQGILDKQDAVTSAFATLGNQAKNELTRSKEIAKILGELTSTEFANGINDKRPGVRAAAKAAQDAAMDRLRELGVNAGNVGKRGMAELAKAMKSKDPDVRAAALALSQTIAKGLVPDTKPAIAKVKSIPAETSGVPNEFLKQGTQAAKNFKDPIAQGAKDAAAAVKGVPAETAGVPNEFWQQASFAGTNLKNGIAAGAHAAAAVVKGVPAETSGVPNEFLRQGQAAGANFGNPIKSATTSAANAAAKAASAAVSAASGAAARAKQLALAALSNISPLPATCLASSRTSGVARARWAKGRGRRAAGGDAPSRRAGPRRPANGISSGSKALRPSS
jgi:colicin import membrane protein